MTPSYCVRGVASFVNAPIERLVLVAGATALAMSAALAGTDTTFAAPQTVFTNYLEGSLGQILAIAALIWGVVGMVARFSMAQIAVPVVLGLAAGVGIPIVTSNVTAII
ncbi:MAG: hypothetical protein AAGC95_00395 [Pseudomonadota bacterium]